MKIIISAGGTGGHIFPAIAVADELRRQDPSVENTFLGEDKEWLIQFANEKIKAEGTNIDYFIFGHRHLTIDWTLQNGHSRYINLGEWLHTNTFAVYDGDSLTIQAFENDTVQIYSNLK